MTSPKLNDLNIRTNAIPKRDMTRCPEEICSIAAILCDPDLENYLGQMYPVEPEIKDMTESNTSASYLYLLLSIGRDGQLHTTFQRFILHVWLRITDEGSIPEMRIWSISLI